MINLEEGEYIIATFRKHWWKIFTWGISMVVLAFIPVVFLFVFLYLIPQADLEHWTYIIGFAYSVWLTVLWILFFVEWTDFYLDVWIVTNKKVVDIDHEGLFAREVSAVRLEDVEDITTESYGILATFLKFGSVNIQTAGSQNEFYLKDAGSPDHIRKVISDLIADAKKHNVSE